MSEENKEIAKKLADLDLPKDFLESEGFKSLDVNADAELTDEIRAKIEEAKKKWAEAQKASEGKDNAQPVKGVINEGDSLDKSATATENTEELAADEIKLVKKEGDVNVDQDWVQRYEAIMKRYAADNQKEWVREEKNEEGQPYEGLKGKIGEADYHFTAPDKAKSNLAGIDGVVALAKETGQSLAYNEKWSDEFKAEVLKACQKRGVSIEGMPEQTQQQTEQRDEPTPAKEEEKAGWQYSRPNVVEYGFKKYAREAAQNPEEFKARIAKMEAEGIKIGDNSTEASHLAMRKYIMAKQEGKTEDVAVIGEALKKYGIASVSFDPEGNSEAKCSVELKDYNTYTPEEKSKISESVQNLQPQVQTAKTGEIPSQVIAQAKVKSNS